MSKENSEPCFCETIENWDFGPVIPVAYNEYKQYGSTDIPSIRSYVVFDSEDPWNAQRIPYKDNILLEDKALINTVVQSFAEYSATDMVRMTCGLYNHTNAEITLSDIRMLVQLKK